MKKFRHLVVTMKVMTAIVAIENGDLNKTVTIGDEINSAYGSGIYIKVGEKLTLRDLLYGLMLRSGNDAALAISHSVSGETKSFVELMNKKAEELGMKNTTFNNPSGLDQDKGNYSTSYDMALLMSYAYKNKEFRRIISTKKYKLKTNMNTYIWHNKNKLLSSYKYTTGGKTGYTEIAKRTLVTTAEHNNLKLVVVTLNDGNDWEDHKKLFEYGFNNYTNYKVLDKNNFKVKDDKYYNDYKLYIKHNYYYPIKRGEEQSILVKVKLKKIRNIKSNMKVGYATVYVADNKKHIEPIYIKNKKENNKKGLKLW